MSGSSVAVRQEDTALARRSNAKLMRWVPSASGKLVGRADIELRNGWQIFGIPVFRDDDGVLNAGSPSIPLTDRDGSPLRDDRGKKRYQQVFYFPPGECREWWNRTILDALFTGGIR